MNINKAEVKIFTAHELGCRLDDLLEANTKDMYRLEGGVVALKQATTSIEGLLAVVDKEMDAEKFSLEQAKEIKRYIQRAAQILTNLTLNTDNNRIAYGGRMQALELAVNVAKKYQDEESKKIAALQTAVEQNRVVKDGDSHTVVDGEGQRPVGVRPKMTIKEQRQAEAAEEAARAAAAESTLTSESPEAEANTEPVAASSDSSETEATNVTPILPKRRGRPRKSA